MPIEELGHAERIVAGALGQPGRRTFYVQVVTSGVVHSYLLEKEQVAILAEQGLSITARISVDEDAVERLVGSGLDILEPAEPEFRIGEMQVRLVEDSEFITLILIVSQASDADSEEGIEVEITPEQLRAMALAATKSVEGGRDICPRCQLPEDPDGHLCPATNGHHAR